MFQLLAEEGVADYRSALLRGRAAITNFFKENIAPVYSMCVHQGHNSELELISDTTATGIWQLENFMLAAETNTGFWIAGYYEDEYIKERGEWKINRTKTNIIFWSDVEKGWAKERFSPRPEV